MREIIVDGLAGAMATVFREGTEPTALPEGARLKTGKKI